MKKCHHFSLGIDFYLKLDWLALGVTSVLGYFFAVGWDQFHT